MSNLTLWDAVETTDPDFTKQMPGKSGLTSINPSYLVKKATDQWGPIGDKWGYEIKEERFDAGAPFLDDENKQLGIATIHTLRLELWYKNADGEKCAIEHYGHTIFIGKNKYGLFTDQDPAKKSLTDALVKCLSMLGFGSDIHMGMYEDNTYVDDLENKMSIDKSDDKAAETLRQEQEYRDWVTKTQKLIETSVSLYELEAIYTAAVRKTKRKGDDKTMKEFVIAKNESKKRLEEEQS